MGDDDWVNSMCAIWARYVASELQSDDPDMDGVYDALDKIEANCQLIAFETGEVPEHLEEHTYEPES